MTIEHDAIHESAILKTISIPGIAEPLVLKAGDCLFLLGRNGVGKSALMHYLNFQMSPDAIYLPGSRPNSFDQEGLGMNVHSRRQYSQASLGWDRQVETRYRSIAGSQRNEKAIFDLHSRETQYSHDATSEIKQLGRESAVIDELLLRESPLDRANQLLEQSNLAVRLKVFDGELMVTQQSSQPYSIVRMSDGERAAVILASEVIAAPASSIFLIDEPERHLHRSISVPLLMSLVAERQDCAFVIATHELALPSEIENAQAILVRGCTWAGDQANGWVLDLLPSVDEIPEESRTDILGSRRKILFIEGTAASRDKPLYAILFPDVSIRPRANCREVQKAVTGLRAIQTLHEIEAFGLVDNDSQSPERIVELAAESIFALPVYSVESLYYAAPVLEAVARRQAETLSDDPAAVLEKARQAALNVQTNEIESLAATVSAQIIHQQVMATSPKPRDLIDGAGAEIFFSLPSPYAAESVRLRTLIQNGDLNAIIQRYPVRQSGILGRLAAALGFRGVQDYERAALTQIAANAEVAASLKASLGDLAKALSNPNDEEIVEPDVAEPNSTVPQ